MFGVRGGCEEWAEVRATRQAWRTCLGLGLDGEGRGALSSYVFNNVESEKQTLCSVENQS